MNKLTQSYGTVEKYVYTTMHPCTYTQHYFLVLFLQQRTTHREKKKKGAPLLLFWFWKIQTNIKKSTVLTATHSLRSSPSGSMTASRKFPGKKKHFLLYLFHHILIANSSPDEYLGEINNLDIKMRTVNV